MATTRVPPAQTALDSDLYGGLLQPFYYSTDLSTGQLSFGPDPDRVMVDMFMYGATASGTVIFNPPSGISRACTLYGGDRFEMNVREDGSIIGQPFYVTGSVGTIYAIVMRRISGTRNTGVAT